MRSWRIGRSRRASGIVTQLMTFVALFRVIVPSMLLPWAHLNKSHTYLMQHPAKFVKSIIWMPSIQVMEGPPCPSVAPKVRRVASC